MRIVVLGGGVVGVTTAYQLQRDGHEVVVIERNPEVASGASFGNAGMIAPGHSFVWSSPRAPIILAKSLMLKDQALRFQALGRSAALRLDLGVHQGVHGRQGARNTLLKHRLAALSQTVLDSVVAEEAIDYDRNTRGILYFYRSQKALDGGVGALKLLESDGQAIKALTRDQVISLEPGLAHAREDRRGHPLSNRRDRRLRQIHPRPRRQNRRTGRRDCSGATVADFRPMAAGYAGAHRPRSVRRRRLRARAWRRKSVLARERRSSPAHPSDQGLLANDPRRRVAIAADDGLCRRAQSGRHFAFSRPPAHHRDRRIRRLRRQPQTVRLRLHETGDAGALSRRRRVRSGGNVGRVAADDADQSSPHRPPAVQNLILNCGHGHVGWTMSHGSARIAADLIAGRAPAIPLDGLMAA